MASNPTVIAVCGSLRQHSYTRIALRHALEAAEESGGTPELLDLQALDLPVFNSDNDTAGDAPELTHRIRTADAIILGTPMYHGSYSSPIKTALDYCGFDEFENKTVGLLGVSGGSFPITALEHLRSVCRALDAWVIPHQAAIPNASSVVDDGTISDSKIEQRVATLGVRAVQFATIEPDPTSFESDHNVGAKNAH